MPKDTSEWADLAELIDQTELPEGGGGVELLAVSHNEFQARWSLTEDILNKGRQLSSSLHNGTHLVLRAFSLPPEAEQNSVSRLWHDFNIEGTENSAYFTLPGPAHAINASIGLVNKEGRFSPLLRAESIELPAPPAEAAVPVPRTSETPAVPEKAPAERSQPRPSQFDHRALDEDEIAVRIARIDGLPESFKAPAQAIAKAMGTGQHDEPVFSEPTAGASSLPEQAGLLNEHAILDTVRAKLAADPEPTIIETRQARPLRQRDAEASGASIDKVAAGAPEQLASQWEDLWSEKAPIEIRAQFIVSGKIGQGLKLLLGGEIVAPAPGGFFVWKREIESFDQVWPMLRAALATPTVPAGPSLDFFKGVEPSERLFELHSALEIEGHVSDPSYIEHLPSDLQVAEDGAFKLSRLLPDGAVILPGISLIAG